MLSRKQKVYLKLNIVSILFTVVSMISVTLAWFAYSGLAKVKTEVGVQAWYIEFEKDDEVVTNNIVISLSDIHPGMDTKNEVINIKNLGDTDAKIKYEISYARILDDSNDLYKIGDSGSNYIEDILSHNYPFHINIGVTKSYIDAKEESGFEISVSWPLDSGDNSLDSLWGRKAYLYEQNQKELDELEKKPAIEIVINVTAEQAIEDLDSIDPDYQLGTRVLYDIDSNTFCEEVSTTCLEGYVIDTNNLIEDEYVNILPNYNFGLGTLNDYKNLSINWNVETRLIDPKDILKVISKDINNSYVKIDGISDTVIGYLNYGTRINNVLAKIEDGYFTYDNTEFTYLDKGNCVWTKEEIAFDSSRLYKEDKDNECLMIPIIKAVK